jgi:DNA-directed RNA polymerase subunit beta
VKVGDRVVPGTVLCDGFATDKGELALGKNLLVAFMPWNGYNFEDAIVISERLVREDVYTSIHIEEFETQVRETKLGPEELTREIPNVNEEDTKHLDEDGIVRIGAEVKDKSILIGKITPKGSSDPTPEEKLLRAIFGDKAGDVRDASLKAPPSFSGIVIDKKLFSSRKKYNAARKERIIKKLAELEKQYQQSLAHLDQEMLNRLERLLEGKTLRTIMTRHEEEIVPEGKKFKRSYFKGIDLTELDPREWTDDPETNRLVERLFHNYKLKRNEIIGRFKRERNQLKVGDDLPTGVLELAKVYVARKRRISVGDKMAGRHGNKGVVAKIARVEDMPFLEDGTPVDIVLNPLGVPSRMNIGQIYETLLGWAGAKLGVKFATPVFDGATEAEVEEWLQKAGLPSQGITYLYDGLSGERFHQPATVGVIYMMKLNHLVDDKMHARSTGPYQLVTQQPLGGKSQFGGQRFGEMEVWALEAFGAAHILREMLTVKSDDVEGRQATYEAIVKRKTFPEPNVPESFTVLVNELRGLALDIIFD